MDTDTITFCCPINVGGVEIAEVEGGARIVSPYPERWEITVEGFHNTRLCLDDIEPTDKDAEFKALLRERVVKHVWAMQDAVQDALAHHRMGEYRRQRATSRRVA